MADYSRFVKEKLAEIISKMVAEPKLFVKNQFDACAQLGRAPETFDVFLPWNIPEEIIVRYDMRQKNKKKR